MMTYTLALTILALLIYDATVVVGLWAIGVGMVWMWGGWWVLVTLPALIANLADTWNTASAVVDQVVAQLEASGEE